MPAPTRYAAVTGARSDREVRAYLPDNYRLVSSEDEPYFDGTRIIEGEDVAGWTLDGYVIPRLASGMIACREQFLHIEDVGGPESGPSISTWLEDEPQS
jgi:hypothetical protein